MLDNSSDYDPCYPPVPEGHTMPQWLCAPRRTVSAFVSLEAIKLDLKKQLIAGYREWPRCKKHDCELEILYLRAVSYEYDVEAPPELKAAFSCPVARACPVPLPAGLRHSS